MRQLRRPAVVVPTLLPEGVGGKKRTANIQEYEQTGTLPSSFPLHWTRPDVRGALYAMQGRVCAYCGADIDEAGIDVEHFRPKSNVDEDEMHGGYWWLAYDFENYFLSCIVCNQKYKRDRFPLSNGAVRVTYESRGQLATEDRILLDPTFDPVEEWVQLEWTTPAPKLIPSARLVGELRDRVQRAIKFFRLNEKAAQRKKRAAIQRLVIEKIEENRAHEVRALAIRFRPHSLVARQILEATAPDFLPTPVEELEWLLLDLSSELLLKLEDLSGPDSSDLDEKEAKELIWGLAVLWKSPPVGNTDFVEQYLERRGLKEIVAEYAALL